MRRSALLSRLCLCTLRWAKVHCYTPPFTKHHPVTHAHAHCTSTQCHVEVRAHVLECQFGVQYSHIYALCIRSRSALMHLHICEYCLGSSCSQIRIFYSPPDPAEERCANTPRVGVCAPFKASGIGATLRRCRKFFRQGFRDS